MTPDITVIGTSAAGLGDEARALIREADLVVGGRRYLMDLGAEEERAFVLRDDVPAALDRIEEAAGRVVVLASGDPGFFGIVRALAGRFGPDALLVLPDISSVSGAFARAGLPWDDAVVVSAHGRDPRRAVNVCRAHPKVAVLTSPAFGPADLARALTDYGRAFVVAERLGGPDEKVYEGDAARIAEMGFEDPNVVVVYDPARAVGPKGWVSGCSGSRGGWALPEAQFEHRSGMITKPEVRALVLARLGPGPGDLVWDVGAGSGSVAVECARLGAAAVAVEREPESCARIRKNAARHDAYVQVVEGEAPGALHDLPDPDSVFVGGSGGRFEEIVALAAARAQRSIVLTLVTLERVAPAAKLLTDSGLEVETTLLQASRVRGVGALSRLVPETPVFVVAGRRTGEGSP